MLSDNVVGAQVVYVRIVGKSYVGAQWQSHALYFQVFVRHQQCVGAVFAQMEVAFTMCALDRQ